MRRRCTHERRRRTQAPEPMQQGSGTSTPGDRRRSATHAPLARPGGPVGYPRLSWLQRRGHAQVYRPRCHARDPGPGLCAADPRRAWWTPAFRPRTRSIASYCMRRPRRSRWTRLFKRKDALPVVLHADHGPAIRFPGKPINLASFMRPSH